MGVEWILTSSSTDRSELALHLGKRCGSQFSPVLNRAGVHVYPGLGGVCASGRLSSKHRVEEGCSFRVEASQDLSWAP